MYTLAGYTVTTTEQVRAILLIAMLKQDARLAKQALSVLKKLGSALMV
jgi:hypothetical protein